MANEFVVKNGLHVPLGSVGSPSIAFLGETTTGIYRSASVTVGIASAGELRGAFGDAIALTPKLGSNFSATTTGVGAIQLSSSNAFTLSGAAASSIYTTNAALSIYTGTGGIDISGDATNTAVNIAVGAGVKTARFGSTNGASGTTVQSGTAGTSVTSTGAFTVTGAAASSIYTTNVNLMIYAGTGRLYIGDDAAANSLRFGAGAAAKEVVVGSTTTTSVTTLQSGTGGTSITSTSFFSISASGAVASYIYTTNAALDIRTGTGGIYIGDDAAANLLRFGAGAAAKTVTIGSTNTTSSTTIQSGTGDILVSSRDAFTIVGYGDAGTLSSIYTNNVGLNIYTGTGTLNISADATASSINLATGAGVKSLTLGSTNTTSGVTIQGGGSGINATSTGNIVVTSSAYSGVDSKISMATAVGGWIKHNNTYFVPAGGTGLQALLQAIIATTASPGTILLEAGTHTISWTSSTVINQEVSIIGSGDGATINFSSTDSDCYLYFTSRCTLRNIKFTGPASGWLSSTMLRVAGGKSEIIGCNFDGAPNAGISYLVYLDAADVLVDHCRLVPVGIAGAASVDYVVYASSNSTSSCISNCYIDSSYASLGSIYLDGTFYATIDHCFITCSSSAGSAEITFSTSATSCTLCNSNITVTAASTGRVIRMITTDTGGLHTVSGNYINESSSATTSRPSTIYWGGRYSKFIGNTVLSANRDHGGAPDTNMDRALIYITSNYGIIQGNTLHLGGTCQLGISVERTGNAAGNSRMEGPQITDNFITGVDGNTASRTGYGIHVRSDATYRPRRGVISDNKFLADSATASYAISTLAGGNGADSWVITGNALMTFTGFSTGDWITGAQEVIANNQAP